MEIRIAAAAILRSDGATLLVRKRATTAFMQPGGKIDAGEAPDEALCRELEEELGVAVTVDQPIFIGRFQAPAANEPDALVIADLFRLDLDTSIEAQAEIDEARWVMPDQFDGLDLAPLTRDCVLPAIGIKV